MRTEVLFSDGTVAEFEDGVLRGAYGGLAIERLRLKMAASAIQIWLRTDGRMELTRGGCQKAIKNVVEPHTGITYKRSRAGKEAALADCVAILAAIESSVVIYEGDSNLEGGES
jgi:hypothetical protein